MFFVKTPGWLKKIFNKYIWHIPVTGKVLYLTFDDGPHDTATPYVLAQLKKYDAKATFFCIGKNIINHPCIYESIIKAGHVAGNHTHNHLNGWKTATDEYVGNVLHAAKYINNSKLFRPPYGRIKKGQGKLLHSHGFHIIMWDVLSGDFDKDTSQEHCLRNIINNASPGSIIVFHDSEKAFDKLEYTLPRVLRHFAALGYCFKAINDNDLQIRA